ncbi:efflux RND transporter periplasmic adaptor subunit [Emcibacter sp. SYSU 3D8]|uniref:efflux RND transporter periplasmic adaptor subunit n=1 Tax=Emcibacter sp. SYSU 3D8 TaxID=3133969 RepID=UPI0031FF399F
MNKRMIIMLAAVFVVLGGVFGWKAFVSMKTAEYMATMKPPPAVVSSAVVTRQVWRSELTSVGTLRAVQSVDLATEVAGTVRQILFESGTEVAKGAPLVRLDTTAEEARLKSLQAEVALARSNFERDTKLINQGHVSQARLDATKSSLDSLLAQADEQRAMIAKKVIAAPFPGRLGIRKVSLGQYVQAGTPMVDLQQLDPIYADFTLPERYIDALGPGQTVSFSVAAFPGKTFTGKVTAVSPRVDSATRSIAMQATVENADRALRPGMFAQMIVGLPSERSVLTLPLSAVTYNPYGNSVFAIAEKGGERTAVATPVQTGETRGGMIEITGGLKEGDQVVSVGQNKLRSGQTVAVDNRVAPPQAVDLP